MSSRRSELVEVEVGTGEAPHLGGPHAGPVHQLKPGRCLRSGSHMEQDGVEVAAEHPSGLRQRGERLERPHAHLYETGRLRRVHLRGHANVLKRLLLHVSGLNLGLLMRRLTGVGTPRASRAALGHSLTP